MNKVVFDIETIGRFEDLDKESQDYILKNDETEEKKADTKRKVNLWPLTSRIAAIALFNPDTEKGKVYFQAPESDINNFEENGMVFEVCSEKEILINFWQDMKNYGQFITFNGRLFDCPYLALRSAILAVKPTKNLMPPRFSDQLHVDLLEQLTFYGAFRKFSLDFYCRSFGIKSPKRDGMSGENVNDYFENKKFVEIARYCADDVRATVQLYNIWLKYIRY